jgi:DNA mismatch repair ATPase MutS
MKRINWIIYAMQFRGNPVMWFMFIMITPLDYIMSIELCKLKKRIAKVLPEWLGVWHRLEALSSAANFAYLNPGYTFPVIMDENSGQDYYLSVEEMGHPLIPESNKVRNGFMLGPGNKINILTGSNMSGKSTFLRTLGINTALAFSGAPVDASKMEVRLSRQFTCIKVSDSVTDGISYFYAEVKRLKTLLLMLDDEEKLPVFFLIDEIFKGTNNVERLVGSRSFIRALEGRKGFGAITTHDLELTKIAGEIASAGNFHFREKVSENVMTFDYLLREGPCPTTNALKIMKIEGLPIEENY